MYNQRKTSTFYVPQLETCSRSKKEKEDQKGKYLRKEKEKEENIWKRKIFLAEEKINGAGKGGKYLEKEKIAVDGTGGNGRLYTRPHGPKWVEWKVLHLYVPG